MTHVRAAKHSEYFGDCAYAGRTTYDAKRVPKMKANEMDRPR